MPEEIEESLRFSHPSPLRWRHFLVPMQSLRGVSNGVSTAKTLDLLAGGGGNGPAESSTRLSDWLSSRLRRPRGRSEGWVEESCRAQGSPIRRKRLPHPLPFAKAGPKPHAITDKPTKNTCPLAFLRHEPS